MRSRPLCDRHPAKGFWPVLPLVLCAIVVLTHRAHAQTVQYAFTNFAGVSSGWGNVDGTGGVARFSDPSGMGVDPAGNLYVADTQNHTIRKVTSAGVVTTLAGMVGQPGSEDGLGIAARFDQPASVALDDAGNLYVADAGNATIRKITPAGVVSTLAGSPGQTGNADGAGSEARFALLSGLESSGLAVDRAGTVYVADTGNDTIRKITATGAVSTLAGSPVHSGTNDGMGSLAKFHYPTGVAVDAGNNVFVVDSLNVTIRKITPAGEVTTLAGSPGQKGSSDGIGSDARFGFQYFEDGSPYGPSSLAIDSAGFLYLSDAQNFAIRKITPTGTVTTLAGSPGHYGYADGAAGQALFSRPGGVATDGSGNIYVADSENVTIRKITSAGVVSTLAGSAPEFVRKDGVGSSARFDGPSGVAIDPLGNLYVSENGYGRTVRRITPEGVVTTFAGCTNLPTGPPCSIQIAGGVGNAARFSSPESVASDQAGNLYVGDYCTVRKITPDGRVTTLAGSDGILGSADGLGRAAQFHGILRGVAVDLAGNVYVADTDNSTIRKITPDGRVTTLAGSAGKEGSLGGTGAAARLYWPVGLAVDSSGTLYTAEVGSHTIRKISPDGVVTTLAGDASILDGDGQPEGGFADGIGSAARFNRPSGVALDLAGNLLVADEQNNAIRKVTPSGVVTTVAGSPSRAGGAEGIGVAAQFSSPEAIAVDSTGALYVIDSFRVTKGTPILVPEPRFGPLSLSNGVVTSSVSGLITGWTLIIQSSSDLRDWSPIQTNTASSASAFINRPIVKERNAEFWRAMAQ